jgi:hypothetical protein
MGHITMIINRDAAWIHRRRRRAGPPGGFAAG